LLFGTPPCLVSTEHTVACPHKHGMLSHSHHNGLSSPVSMTVGQLNKDVEEDDVFMQLELPLERDSGSGSSSASPASPPYPQFETHQKMNFPNLHRSRTITGAPSKVRGSRSPGLPQGEPGPLGDNIYEWLQTNNKISEEDLDKLDKMKERSDNKYLENEFDSLTYNIALSRDPKKPAGPRYVELPGEDSVFGDIYGGSEAYVKFDILPVEPQYHYPNLDTAMKGAGQKSEVSSEAPIRLKLPSPPLNKKKQKEKDKKIRKYKKDQKRPQARLLQERCVHCHQLFSQSENPAGSCRYAPDVLKQGIECMSCLACAKCLLYHCHYEDENFTDEDICTCDNTDGHLGKRWLGLSLLAVLVPCLCLFPLLTACHGCGRACKMCGGRHQS